MSATAISSHITPDQVAPDLRESIRAFQAVQGQTEWPPTTPDEYRAVYRQACQREGLAEEVAELRELSCPTADGATLALRYYRGQGVAADAPSAGILFMHGGGWVVGDLDTHDSVCRLLANRAQARVVAVDYRLAPEHKFPTPVFDCRDALAWLIAEAEALNIDPRRIVAAGDSAGGHLSAVLASQADLRPDGFQFQGQVLIYPPVDMSQAYPSYRRIISGVPVTYDKIHWFKEQYLAPETTDLSGPWFSPLSHLSEAPQPPIYLLTVGIDPLVDEGIAYAAKALALGHTLLHRHYPRHTHGIITSPGKLATTRKILEEIALFIRSLEPVTG